VRATVHEAEAKKYVEVAVKNAVEGQDEEMVEDRCRLPCPLLPAERARPTSTTRTGRGQALRGHRRDA
jgi:hypothetical protein